MHVFDAGPGCGPEPGQRGERDRVRLRCQRCKHETDWILLNATEAKRGIPCPACNAGPPAIDA